MSNSENDSHSEGQPKLSTALTTDSVRTELAIRLPHWRLETGCLTRRFSLADWRSVSLAFGAIAHLAEAAWHHPEITASYHWLEVRLTTHDAGGVTVKDFDLAEAIDRLLLWRAAAGAAAGRPDYIKQD